MEPIEEKQEIQLLKRAAAGDPEAFEQIVLRYQTPVYNLCLRITGNADDAADLTQEAFLKIWRSLDGFHFESAFTTWLYRLASNVCLDHLRAIRRRPQISLSMEDEDGEEKTIDLPDSAPTPEEQLLAREEKEQLAAAMQLLSVEQRQILTLRVVDDLSYTEIAEILGVREGTVKSRLARARDQLRKKLLQTGNKSESKSSNRQKKKGGSHL